MSIAILHADPRIGLLDNWQRDFPLCQRPYANLGRSFDLSEAEVISVLSECQEDGRLSRVGAVIKPNSVGASTLAAMAVPEERMEEVADLVNAEPGVNHNYEREHDYNLWFVVTARDAAHLERVLEAIATATGLRPLNLPLLEDYFIDLGFRLQWT